MITQEQLKEILDYNPRTGVFRWRIQPANNIPAGSIAGSKDTGGYIKISIADRKRAAHRLAWLYVYGSFPPYQIDHIDHIRDNNRLGNLRPATKAQNQAHSRKVRKGLKGAYPQPYGRWQSYVQLNKKRMYLGTFATEQEAHAAYADAAKRAFGQYCCLI